MKRLLAPVADTIARCGFAFVRAPEMAGLLESSGLRDWRSFADSWDDLGVDAYMADGGRYRRRRFAAFRAGPAGIARKPHQPHYQSRDYNALNGGIERWFEPVTEATAAHPALSAILRTSHALFDQMTPEAVRPRPGMSRSTSSASRRGRARPVSRPPRACTATVSIGCWC